VATDFYFKAVASDGKMRTGILHGDTERWVAQELRKQGLTPVYVGLGEKKSFELKLPGFARGKRRDVLFFTQELSTLLNAGVPLDRSLSITTELTERPAFRAVLTDVLRVLKSGKSLADSLAALMDRDSHAYDLVVAAFRLPKGTENESTARGVRIQEALHAATEAPLDVMRACAEAIGLAAVVAAFGNRNAVSDVQVGLELLRAGLRGAKLNVDVNLASIKDETFSAAIRREVEHLAVEGERGTSAAVSRLESEQS